MKNRKNIFIVILTIILIVLFTLIYMLFMNKNNKTYKGVATIVDVVPFKSVIVEIKEKNNSVVGSSTIYSSIFRINDKINVEYTKKGKEINISKIESISNTKIEKAQKVSSIRTDTTLRGYKDKLSGTVDISKKKGSSKNTMSLEHIEAFPVKILGQSYNEIINPKEFYEIKNYGKDGIFDSTEKGLNITMKVKDKFKILSLKNTNNGITKDISYNSTDSSFTLTSIGEGIYTVQIEYENKDIINYTFI